MGPNEQICLRSLEVVVAARFIPRSHYGISNCQPSPSHLSVQVILLVLLLHSSCSPVSELAVPGTTRDIHVDVCQIRASFECSSQDLYQLIGAEVWVLQFRTA